MNDFDDELQARLASIEAQTLYRRLRRVDSAQGRSIQVDGKSLLNFSSNDYLGLANEPALKEAAIRAIEQFGVGAGASRLICGSLAPYHELEETIAAFKKTDAAISFSTGYAAALGAICGLMSKNDVIVLDKLVHASIVDAARLSGAKLRIFSHNDLNELEDILKWANARTLAGARPSRPAALAGGAGAPQRSRVLIVTESVFSMDGDRAPLKKLVELKDAYGAWLMLDEAHATGMYGPAGRGLAAEHGLSGRVEIQMGTLGKALGAAGGFICGSRVLIDYLINRARSFVFSTAPVPAAAAAATAGIQFSESAQGDERRRQLWQRVDQFNQELGNPITPQNRAAIIPVMLGDETAALNAADSLRKHGYFVPAIRYPTVARGAARLRVTLSAAHTSEDVSELAAALKGLRGAIPESCHHSDHALAR